MKKVFLKIILGLSLIKVVNCGTPKFVIPPTSPTRHQFIAGIGVPLSLKEEAITYGWTLKAQYFLPETIDQLKFQFFPDIFEGMYNNTFLFDTVWQRFPNGRRRREIVVDPRSGQKYEKHNPEVGSSLLKDDFEDQFEEDIQERKMLEDFKQIGNEKFGRKKELNRIEKEIFESPLSDGELGPDLSVSRWNIYDAFAATLESKGLNGRFCVLRAICEASHTEFSHETLMGELFHVFFIPSTTSEPINRSSDYDYFKAEMIGRENEDGKCQKVFHKCKESVMEIFTQIFD